MIQQMEAYLKQNVPMIDYSGLEVISVDNEKSVVKVPFKHETKNHLNSMYFGALAVGADAAGGLLAFSQIMQSGQDIAMVFKDFTARFLRRPEADVFFVCQDGKVAQELVQKAIESGERVNAPVKVLAVLDQNELDEPVAEFDLTLSLKLRK